MVEDKGFQEPYLRELLKGRILIADRGFDGLRLPHTKVMTAGRGKGNASQRQYVESVLSVVGNSLRLPWKKGITAQAYIYAKSIAFNRKTKSLLLLPAVWCFSYFGYKSLKQGGCLTETPIRMQPWIPPFYSLH